MLVIYLGHVFVTKLRPHFSGESQCCHGFANAASIFPFRLKMRQNFGGVENFQELGGGAFRLKANRMNNSAFKSDRSVHTGTRPKIKITEHLIFPRKTFSHCHWHGFWTAAKYFHTLTYWNNKRLKKCLILSNGCDTGESHFPKTLLCQMRSCSEIALYFDGKSVGIKQNHIKYHFVGICSLLRLLFLIDTARPNFHCLFVFLSFCLFVFLSFCLFVFLSFCLFIGESVGIPNEHDSPPKLKSQ